MEKTVEGKPKDKAIELWDKIEHNLDDRGCFNGIDDDARKELRGDLIAVIRGSLSADARTVQEK